jgi:hypothetical protein
MKLRGSPFRQVVGFIWNSLSDGVAWPNKPKFSSVWAQPLLPNPHESAPAPEQPLHNADRMPVLLAEKHFEPWVTRETCVELLKPAPNGHRPR